VERFSEMQADLDRERKAMTKRRAKREEQLRAVLDAPTAISKGLRDCGSCNAGNREPGTSWR
jgi:hypothetical protein